MLHGTLHDCVINIPSPFKENSLISLSINKTKEPVNTVQMVNNSPFITSEIYIEATILSLDENSDYTNGENLELVTDYTNKYLESHIKNYLYRTAHDFNSDIFGFGRKILTNYLTTEDWNKVNWLENYQNSVFKVKVSSEVKTSTIIIKNS